VKYALVLFIYSLANTSPILLKEKLLPIEYPTYYDCISDGYITSYSEVMRAGRQIVEDQKIAIKFECRPYNSI
jgi:hypothetical protein